MAVPDIYLTTADREKLLGLLDAAAKTGEMPDTALRDLRAEILQAQVVGPREIPPDTITMNTRAVLQLEGEDMEMTLAYPDDADMSQGRVSVLAPVGTAILGYRQGDTIRWSVPNGEASIVVKKILYQPEASGAEDE